MAVTKLSVSAIERFAEGREFGNAGAYVRIKGIARGKLDPAAPENQEIIDLDKAERNARGMVEYEADFFVLRPADPRRGSGALVYDVTNRGRKMHLQPARRRRRRRRHQRPEIPAGCRARLHPWAGLFSLVWSGWDSGAPRAGNGMTARLPAAVENGKPMVRRIRDEFHIGTRPAGDGDVVRLSYPAVSTDPRNARLTVRERESDARTDIPAGAWEFLDERTIRLLPAGRWFAPYDIYEIWYEATGSTVSGVGFAATATSSRSCAITKPTATGRPIR